MKKSVWHEKSDLTGTYSLRWYDPYTGKKQRLLCDSFAEVTTEKAKKVLYLDSCQTGRGMPEAAPLGIFDQYLEEISTTLRASTIELKKFAVTPYLIRIVRMANIDELSIRLWQKDMAKRYKTDTVSLRLRELKAFLNWCVKKDIILANPFTKITIPSSTFVGRRIAVPEFQAILSKCTPDFIPFLLMAIETGARRGELLKATWNNIDFDNSLWHIPIEHSKTKTARWLPLSDLALSTLKYLYRSIQSPDEQIFLGWQNSTVRSKWERAKRDARIKGRMRIHDIRHTFASNWKGRGDSLKAYCGWTTDAMLSHYKHVEMNELRADMAASRKQFGVDLGQLGPSLLLDRSNSVEVH